MIGVVGASVGNVIQYVGTVEAVALGDGEETLGPEGALGVDVQALPFGAAHVDGQLASDGHRVTQLTFAGTELPEQLSDGPRLNATVQQLVQLLAPGGHLQRSI